jgi:Kef-type K+ transport system membrane component KefB
MLRCRLMHTAANTVPVQVLLAAALVILCVRSIGWVVGRVGQPRVLGEIVAGVALGPSVLGALWPGAVAYLFPARVTGALGVLAQLGLVLFMVFIGLELDLRSLRGHGRRVAAISQTSILVPMLLGAGLGLWLYPRFGGEGNRTAFCLFLGAAVSITAFPVLARVLQETGLLHSRIGVLTLTCAALNDVAAWCLLAVVVALIDATGPADAVVVLLSSVGYLLIMVAIVKPLLARVGRPPVWAVLVVGLLSAWATEQIGVHAIFGAFVAGAMMPRDATWRLQVRERLEGTVSILLLPFFFVVVGLATQVGLLDSAYLWGVTAVVIAVAVAGKFGGATIAARVTGERWADATAIGILMNTRGLTEIVILSVGLQLRVITPTLFTIMVLMALVTTFMATPVLHLVFRLRRDPRAEGTVEQAVSVGRRR